MTMWYILCFFAGLAIAFTWAMTKYRRDLLQPVIDLCEKRAQAYHCIYDNDSVLAGKEALRIAAELRSFLGTRKDLAHVMEKIKGIPAGSSDEKIDAVVNDLLSRPLRRGLDFTSLCDMMWALENRSDSQVALMRLLGFVAFEHGCPDWQKCVFMARIALLDSSARVRDAAVDLLVDLDGASSIRVLKEVARHDASDAVKANAISGLSFLGEIRE